MDIQTFKKLFPSLEDSREEILSQEAYEIGKRAKHLVSRIPYYLDKGDIKEGSRLMIFLDLANAQMQVLQNLGVKKWKL